LGGPKEIFNFGIKYKINRSTRLNNKRSIHRGNIKKVLNPVRKNNINMKIINGMSWILLKKCKITSNGFPVSPGNLSM
jgi:hypothetical protein